MYHSITFGNKNTWDDWHLVPESRPVFAPPAPKTNYLDIPGADGLLDMSEALTGYPVFENRQGSFTFLVINKSDGLSSPDTKYGEWYERYSDILTYLHGRKMRAVLEDDPSYFYEGRFSVNEWASEPERSKITIDYSVSPYKWFARNSVEESWLWDDLNFNDSTTNIKILRYKDISLNSDTAWTSITIRKEEQGTAPICPAITVDLSNDGTPIQVLLPNMTIDQAIRVANTESVPYSLGGLVMTGKEDVTLKFKGKGAISILFRQGRL